MKKIDVPFVFLVLFILLVFMVILSAVNGGRYTDTIVFGSFYFLPLSVLTLIIYKIFTHTNSKLFWVVLILNILFFIIFYLWVSVAGGIMSSWMS